MNVLSTKVDIRHKHIHKDIFHRSEDWLDALVLTEWIHKHCRTFQSICVVQHYIWSIVSGFSFHKMSNGFLWPIMIHFIKSDVVRDFFVQIHHPASWSSYTIGVYPWAGNTVTRARPTHNLYNGCLLLANVAWKCAMFVVPQYLYDTWTLDTTTFSI